MNLKYGLFHAKHNPLIKAKFWNSDHKLQNTPSLFKNHKIIICAKKIKSEKKYLQRAEHPPYLADPQNRQPGVF